MPDPGFVFPPPPPPPPPPRPVAQEDYTQAYPVRGRGGFRGSDRGRGRGGPGRGPRGSRRGGYGRPPQSADQPHGAAPEPSALRPPAFLGQHHHAPHAPQRASAFPLPDLDRPTTATQADADAGQPASPWLPPAPALSEPRRPHPSAKRARVSDAPSNRGGAASERGRAPPAVPSFGLPLPTAAPAHPPQQSPGIFQAPDDGDGPVAAPPRKRKRNPLGLTPRTDAYESSDDDGDEEARLAAGFAAGGGGLGGSGGGGLAFEHKGRMFALRSPEDVAAWIAERKRAFPTRARAEERARKAEEERLALVARKRAELEARRAERAEQQRQRQEELKPRKPQRNGPPDDLQHVQSLLEPQTASLATLTAAAAPGQAPPKTDKVDEAAKAQRKAEKLQAKLEKAQRRVEELTAKQARGKQTSGQTPAATQPSDETASRNEQKQARSESCGDGDGLSSDVRALRPNPLTPRSTSSPPEPSQPDHEERPEQAADPEGSDRESSVLTPSEDDESTSSSGSSSDASDQLSEANAPLRRPPEPSRGRGRGRGGRRARASRAGGGRGGRAETGARPLMSLHQRLLARQLEEEEREARAAEARATGADAAV